MSKVRCTHQNLPDQQLPSLQLICLILLQTPMATLQQISPVMGPALFTLALFTWQLGKWHQMQAGARVESLKSR